MIVRSYETFTIDWLDGSTWSGYASAAEAQETADGSDRAAETRRHVFKVQISPERLHLYEPGIGDEEPETDPDARCRQLRTRTETAGFSPARKAPSQVSEESSQIGQEP